MEVAGVPERHIHGWMGRATAPHLGIESNGALRSDQCRVKPYDHTTMATTAMTWRNPV